MNIPFSFLIAAVATFGFAIQFNAPSKTIIPTCIASGFSWIIYDLIKSTNSNYILAGFVASFLLGIIGEFLARRYECPSTMFILPGLIPLVPGAGLYYAMNSLIEQKYSLFTKMITETFFTAAALSMGIVVASVFSRSLRGFKIRRRYQSNS